jgi:DNA-binding NtrC family response regulator
MPDKPEDANERRRRRPGDHIASKHEAFRSELVQSLVKDLLIVGATTGQARLLNSLLRAILGRTVEAKTAAGLDDAILSLDATHPNLILLRGDASERMTPADAITRLRTAGFKAPIIVICDRLSARDAIDLRRAGALDVIEVDDLNSVRLFEALLKATQPQPPGPGKIAWL